MAEQSSTRIFGRSTVFFIGALAVFIMFAACAWWLLRTEYAPLFKESTEASQAEILATLSQNHVPYRINAQQNTVEVPVEHIAAARMYLAQAGIPTRSGSGFELFDQADYGMSEFSQRINYQRALEGELARTIMTMSEVQFARVHLTFKKPGLFQGNEEQPKASVIVRLRSEGNLSAQRVRGIQQLVASAVENMTLERVALLSEQGQILSSSDASITAPEQQQVVSELEQTLQHKAEQMLVSSGLTGSYVSVRLEMNFDKVKSVREQPLPATGDSLVRHEKRSSSSENSSGQTTSKRSQDSRETNYEIGKEHSEIEHATGKVERISIGIALPVPLAKEPLSNLRSLLIATLGMNEKRGDQLAIMFTPQNVTSTKSKPAATASEPADVPEIIEPNFHPVQAEAVSVESSPHDPRYIVLAAGVLALALISGLFVVLGKRTSCSTNIPSRLSSEEREQLLVDLRHWMQEGR
jgi:flagellar M-ring protein FliF